MHALTAGPACAPRSPMSMADGNHHLKPTADSWMRHWLFMATRSSVCGWNARGAFLCVPERVGGSLGRRHFADLWDAVNNQEVWKQVEQTAIGQCVALSVVPARATRKRATAEHHRLGESSRECRMSSVPFARSVRSRCVTPSRGYGTKGPAEGFGDSWQALWGGRARTRDRPRRC